MHNATQRPSLPSPRRFLPATALLLAVAVSGCGWFHHDNVFAQSEESRPLEVPPDLDLPDTTGAMKLPDAAPSSVTRSSLGASPTATSPSGFNVAGDKDAMFAKVGEVLAATPGVAIASRAQLLGAYDVSYEGSNFLVRITPVEGGSYVSAVDPRGVPATDAAAVKLVAALKAAVGG
jgi:uncharacterized lipoprotein